MLRSASVLDDGFVHLLDIMGSDEDIVKAARVSYNKHDTPQDVERLLRYLMRHEHLTPFEMCELKFHVRVPMDCWRQWIRHRTANVNERSTRYIELEDSEFYETSPTRWRTQASNKKQGSAKENISEELGVQLSQAESVLHKHAYAVYSEAIKLGVAREQARKVLPLSTYTEAYWKIDLRNLLNFLNLRLSPDAQYEIRQYAQAIAGMVQAYFPLTWTAFLDYWHVPSFSRYEIDLIRKLLNENLDIEYAVDSYLKEYPMTESEKLEFKNKVLRYSDDETEGVQVNQTDAIINHAEKVRKSLKPNSTINKCKNNKINCPIEEKYQNELEDEVLTTNVVYEYDVIAYKIKRVTDKTKWTYRRSSCYRVPNYVVSAWVHNSITDTSQPDCVIEFNVTNGGEIYNCLFSGLHTSLDSYDLDTVLAFMDFLTKQKIRG